MTKDQKIKAAAEQVLNSKGHVSPASSANEYGIDAQAVRTMVARLRLLRSF